MDPTRFSAAAMSKVSAAVAFFTFIAVAAGGFASADVPPASSSSALFSRTEFEQLWTRTDGPVAAGKVSRSWLWGPAPGESMSEPFSRPGTPNASRQVQYFDKARMELNSDVTDPASPWRVTTGLLVSEMVLGKIQTGETTFVARPASQEPVAGDAGTPTNPRYADFTALVGPRSTDRTGAAVDEYLTRGSPVTTGPDRGARNAAFVLETGHNIPDVFTGFMYAEGQVQEPSGALATSRLFDWVYLLGYPITEPYWVNLRAAGRDHVALVQLFQRRVLTYVPDFPRGWQVQMGNVGQHYLAWRFGAQSAAGGVPTGTPMPALLPASGGFVGVKGDRFIYRGQDVQLKGTNYWMSTHPFVDTWSGWDGPQALRELKNAHEMGVNTVRVGLPYDHFDTLDIVWDGDKSLTAISGGIINEMTQLLQVAATYDMKVIFVLFDWYDGYPSAGTRQDRSNSAYIQGIVGPFANDDRVLAWDLHNEPDFYGGWQTGGRDQVIDWLARTYARVREVDRRHPVTVGVGDYRSLWSRASSGVKILDLVDFASFHCYDAGALEAQYAETRRQTSKPILLEEMGWPTAPGDKPPAGQVFSEPQQDYLYTSMLEVARRAGIQGVVQWTLYDFAAGSTTGGKSASYEEHFGLIRLDGTLKPAAKIFQEGYPSRGLPSDTRTNVKLTPRT